MAKQTPIERIKIIAKQDFMTLTQLAEVSCVGINKAANIRVELVKWMKHDKKYPYVDSSRLLTTAVFEFLGLDIDKYLEGGKQNVRR